MAASAAPTVIVTRPAREAASWIDGLRAAGIDAVALPLIVIAPLVDGAALRLAWAGLAQQAALMFVSAAAVDHFFGVGAALGAAVPAHCRFWATGPGTAAALRRNGVPAEAIDVPASSGSRFDSEALWSLVQHQVVPGMRVLIVRGGDAQGRPSGRDWLARTLEAAGGRCDSVAAYRRLPPVFDTAQRRLAEEGAAGRALWLFSSSEAIANLLGAMPDARWHAARAIATHERIAEAALHAGFGTVRTCAPLQDALVASIESLA